MRPNAKELRDIYLSQLAIELEEEDGIKAAIHLHVLKHHEKIKQGYEHIKLHKRNIEDPEYQQLLKKLFMEKEYG